jgi:hypothetical protein
LSIASSRLFYETLILALEPSRYSLARALALAKAEFRGAEILQKVAALEVQREPPTESN